METENSEKKEEALNPDPSNGVLQKQQELLVALQEEKKKCWEDISAILKNRNLRFSVSVTLSDPEGAQFVIDLVKNQ